MGTVSHSASRRRWVGDFEIIRPIGRGGIAVVYLARQASLDRGVALKELNSFQAGSSDMAERFVRESRIAGSLNHPNVATVFEYFEHEGTPYIAMEYLPRGSLRPYVGRLSLPQFVGVMEAVLSGLAHAQTLGIVHRDLKPENLLVTDEGRVKITDFGIAKATQTAHAGAFLTTTGTTVGTPTYMAPEQAMAGKVGAWTDLYSVGVMAWEHMVGHVPFHDAEAPMVVVMRHINEPIPAADEVNREVDPEISRWIDRLLTKDPQSRPDSPAAVWDELEEIAIRRLGPRWRSGARLPTSTQILDTPPPLTPAPFDSQEGPKADPATPATPQPGPSYLTFDRAPWQQASDRDSPSLGAPSQEPHQTAPGQLTLPPTPPRTGTDLSFEPPAGRADDPDERVSSVSARSAHRTDTEEPPGQPTGRRAKPLHAPRRLIAAAALAGVTAFAATALTTGGAARVPPVTTVSSAPFRLSLPADWQRGPTRSLPSLALAHELVLRPKTALDEMLAIGTTRTTDATLLPNSLLATVPHHAVRGELVTLGYRRFYRYRDVTASGSSQVETLYALPTTTGTVVAACVSDAPNASFTAACEHVLGTLVLDSRRALALGPNHTYAAALSDTIGRLNADTRSAQARLTKARSANAQATAARQIAAGYLRAAAALPNVGPDSVAQPAQNALRTALMALGHAYRQLARAAAANDSRAYTVTRRSITRAQARVETALAELRRFGYQAGRARG